MHAARLDVRHDENTGAPGGEGEELMRQEDSRGFLGFIPYST